MGCLATALRDRQGFRAHDVEVLRIHDATSATPAELALATPAPPGLSEDLHCVLPLPAVNPAAYGDQGRAIAGRHSSDESWAAGEEGEGQPDPASGRTDYMFVGGDPINAVDPSGEKGGPGAACQGRAGRERCQKRVERLKHANPENMTWEEYVEADCVMFGWTPFTGPPCAVAAAVLWAKAHAGH
jgi:hypothetical protein